MVSPVADRKAAGPAAVPVVRCGFCGDEFVEDPAQLACRSCPVARGCGLARCPRCGYENPKEPGWIVRLRRWMP
jgi:hypothetical protein